mgnify:CR=1 FL=1
MQSYQASHCSPVRSWGLAVRHVGSSELTGCLVAATALRLRGFTGASAAPPSTARVSMPSRAAVLRGRDTAAVLPPPPALAIADILPLAGRCSRPAGARGGQLVAGSHMQRQRCLQLLQQAGAHWAPEAVHLAVGDEPPRSPPRGLACSLCHAHARRHCWAQALRRRCSRQALRHRRSLKGQPPPPGPAPPPPHRRHHGEGPQRARAVVQSA